MGSAAQRQQLLACSCPVRWLGEATGAERQSLIGAQN
jgi:hypothetical protein